MPIICVEDENPEVSLIAKEIIAILNTEKLRKYAINLLLKDDTTEDKIVIALRAIGYSSRAELDEEEIHLLV